MVGIAIGLPILWFVPSLEGQLILLVITGVLFFAFRNVQYAHATMFITLLVLLCFNLLGEGFEVALPRVIDTLIGCAIAWAAVSFIWPDWRFRNLPRIIVWPTVSLAVTRITVMLNSPPWCQTCRASRM